MYLTIINKPMIHISYIFTNCINITYTYNILFNKSKKYSTYTNVIYFQFDKILHISTMSIFSVCNYITHKYK